MSRRSFSLMLAWRYLNPRRAMLSAVTLISVSGVLLGVMVLVVVMSVYAGIERDVKGRVLGFIPHVQLNVGLGQPISNWREISDEVSRIPGVSDAGPFLQDNVLIDIEGKRSAGVFRAIDTTNPSEVEGIQAMLDLEDYPDGSADMGLDDYVVISSKTAKAFKAGIGDTMNLLTLRNLQLVEAAYEKTREPPVRERFAAELAEIRKIVEAGWMVNGEEALLSRETWNDIYGQIIKISESNIRDAENDILFEAYQILDSAIQKGGPESLSTYKQAPKEFLECLERFQTTDVTEMDANTLKALDKFVLPKEATIIGVYQASQMMLTPDVFMPLHLGQELSGLEDEVQAVAVRLDDPYQVEAYAAQLSAQLPEGWRPVTWIEQIQDFSILLQQQKVMMYFVLSLIIVISAFSMTAVMFTVTIQKRREIGVMKALGAAPGQIVRVFVYQGMILGAAGSVIGVGLGLLVVHFRQQVQEVLRVFGFDPFSKSHLGFTVLPAHINPLEITIIAVCAFLLCAVAAYIPAFAAARSDAARSLRNL